MANVTMRSDRRNDSPLEKEGRGMNIWPDLPETLVDHGMTEEELGDLWYELIVELIDQEYISRTHNKRTYDAGCRGPLCRKATREAGRRRNRTTVHEKYLFVDPILDFWHPIAVERIARVRARLVQELTA